LSARFSDSPSALDGDSHMHGTSLASSNGMHMCSVLPAEELAPADNMSACRPCDNEKGDINV
ncbi:MAG: hypothetical protein SGPRY_008642, partial [Prymnesium sp.]